jgi:hypothetical protein
VIDAGRGERAEYSADVSGSGREPTATPDGAPSARSAQHRSFAIRLLAFRGCATRRKLESLAGALFES